VIYGFTHAVAIYDVFAGKTAAWVPSHGNNRATPLAVKVKRMMAWYLTITFSLAIVGIAFRLSPVGGGYGLAGWWSLIAFVVINLYVFAPVAAESFRTLRQDKVAARRAVTQEKFSFYDNRTVPATVPASSTEVVR
jgi:hypothetical protein